MKLRANAKSVKQKRCKDNYRAMNLLPDITEDGKLIEPPGTGGRVNFHAPDEFRSDRAGKKFKYVETSMEELNNLGRETMTEDFSDSPHLNA